jgi:superfamily II DNA/RNA helicase
VPHTEEPLTTQHITAEDEPAGAQQAAAEEPHAVAFSALGVDDIICQGLASAGIYTTFPIQALTLPIALGGQDIIGQARTGTGKTLAFGVPLLQRLIGAAPDKRPTGLVVVPTRELAVQVAKDIEAAGAYLKAHVVTVYGGRAYEPQIDALRKGSDIVVGTPGRLIDLANRRDLDLSGVQALVLDEADKMLDLGFLPDVERIVKMTPETRQTMLFSATMPGEVVTLARRHMHRPMNIRAEHSNEPEAVPAIEQHVFRTHHLDKIEVLARVLQAKDRGLSMVFTQTKRTADQVSTALTGRGFAVGTVHGDLGQAQRERSLRAFRGGKVDVLVATDVAARGIDIDDVTHVINYECPEDEKAYVHRIGRTGRAGRTGVSVTFVDWQDMQRWKLINDAYSLGMAEPAETYSNSEHLYAELSIPPHATGTLPREQRARAGLAAEETEDLGETGLKRSPRSRKRSGPAARSGRGDTASSSSGRSGGAGASGTRGAPAADGAAAGAARAPRRRRRTRGGREIEGDRKLSLDNVSTPTSLQLPEGVQKTSVTTTRGVFAALEAVPVTGPADRAPALLVPGYTGSKEDFLLILERLAAAGRRVISVDQRGQYETPGSDDPVEYQFPALGADVAALMAATGARHLLGHSFGGLVARETVLGDHQPTTFTLMSSGPSGLEGERATELRGMLSVLGTEVSAQRVRAIWESYLEPQAVASGTPKAIIAFLRERMLGSSAAGLMEMGLQLLTAPDKTDELAKAGDFPVLVLYGEDDNAWLPSTQEEMASRIGAERVCIPGAAHSPAIEAPATTSDALTAFWNSSDTELLAESIPGAVRGRRGGSLRAVPYVIAPPAPAARARREDLVAAPAVARALVGLRAFTGDRLGPAQLPGERLVGVVPGQHLTGRKMMQFHPGTGPVQRAGGGQRVDRERQRAAGVVDGERVPPGLVIDHDKLAVAGI